MSVLPSFGPILLAHSYYLQYDEKQVRKMKPYSPLATLIVAAVLRERGYNVRLFDAMLSSGVEEFLRELDTVKPAAVVLVEDNFNFLTKMCTLRMREAAFRMIQAAKARCIRVAVNGSDATDHIGSYLGAGADAVILGEPEQTVSELLARWEVGDADLQTVRGLAFQCTDSARRGEGTSICQTSWRPFLKNLDSLPLPAWDLVDVERYRSVWHRHHGRFSWNVVTSRGCPYHCNWCAKPVFGNRYAQRSAGDVAEEFAHLRQGVRPDHVWFADDIFGLTERWIKSFAEEIAARDARIPFMMQTRASLLKPSVAAALAISGAEEVWLGVESGAQHILDAMDKRTTIDQIRTATRALKQQNIRAGWFVQLGYLGEQWGDILATRDLIREESPDDIGVSVAYPLPGTKFFHMVKQQLGQKRNWVDSDELAMMFAGTFPTEVYREVRTLMHHEVDSNVSGSRGVSDLDARWEELEARAHARV